MFLKDGDVHASFLGGWQTGAAANFEPVVAELHIGGRMVAVWTLSSIWTIGCLVVLALAQAEDKEATQTAICVATNLVGFGSIGLQTKKRLIPGI